MLQVLYVAYQTFTEATGTQFLRAVIEGSPALSAIRFNSVDGYLGKINLDDFNPNFDNLRTIQVMHGHKMLVSSSLCVPRTAHLNLRTRHLPLATRHVSPR